ncbi:MAG: aminotransferase class V-fold PLP-dependent enzyme [Cyclobacteriaceae bacterium]|nr:aminotransferase class V-fold PLP-dependent enzyme [Cyclobacteriaceae bacterium]
MKKIYFTPGPSELYFTVEDHIKTALKKGVPSISHRSSQFKSIYSETVEGIRQLLNLPENYYIGFTSSANEVWERILQNLVVNKSTHLVNGAFSNKFYEFATLMGKDATKIEADYGQCIDPKTVSLDPDTELLAITHNETSSGANQTLDDIKSLREMYPDQLLALDVVSSAPSYPIDYSMVDTAYFSVQKCFGLPAGLGVWIYNDRCLEKNSQIQKTNSTGTYHRLSHLHEMGLKNQNPETPNVLGIYLLGEVVKDMLRKGQETIWRETQYKSSLLYHNLENHSLFTPFVKKKEWRSNTTLVFECKNPSEVIEKLSEKNMIIGKGYGKYADSQIRIANFPTHSKEQVELLVDILLSLN